MSLLGMVRGLGEAGVKYVVIGGVAGAAHGSVRVTDDLDICYETSEENRSRLAALLVGWQAYLRGVEPGLPFILDERTLRDSETLTLVTSQGNLDLFQRVAGVGSYADCIARSEGVAVGDVRFDVLDLRALIDAKRAAGRGKDIEHLRELEALLELGSEIEDEGGK
jgi:predicted nucleotidyltransferase